MVFSGLDETAEPFFGLGKNGAASDGRHKRRTTVGFWLGWQKKWSIKLSGIIYDNAQGGEVASFNSSVKREISSFGIDSSPCLGEIWELIVEM